MTFSDQLRSRLEQYALISLEKQDRLDLLLGDHLHELDLDKGVIRCNDYEFTMQVIGTESDNTLTWLWAWADEQTEELPQNLLDASLQLQDWGRSETVPEFTIPSLDLDRADGHTVSLVAAHVCSASCFYREVFEGGAVYILLFDNRIDAQFPFDRERLLRSLRDLFSRYELNHRHAVISYLQLKGLPFSESGPSITFFLQSREQLRLEFDPQGILTSVDGAPFSLV